MGFLMDTCVWIDIERGAGGKMNREHRIQAPVLFVLALMLGASARAADRVRIDAGSLEGMASADRQVRIFKGIPYAAPPVGAFALEAAPTWWRAGPAFRKATEFGARCMQGSIYSDMIFRDPGPSEDCLYLNVWTPATSGMRGCP